MNDTSETASVLRPITSALANGLVVVDAAGQIVWMDEGARRHVNGGLSGLSSALRTPAADGVPCLVSTIEMDVEGERRPLCVLHEGEDHKTGRDLIAGLEAILSDSSWFTRTIIDKLKAWRQAKRPATARASDLDLLSEREREILALICEGRSDSEMSKLLNLSQNTVRNHVASLYRKIGVNRRSAAIIWARERAITNDEFIAARSARPKRNRPSAR